MLENTLLHLEIYYCSLTINLLERGLSGICVDGGFTVCKKPGNIGAVQF